MLPLVMLAPLGMLVCVLIWSVFPLGAIVVGAILGMLVWGILEEL